MMRATIYSTIRSSSRFVAGAAGVPFLDLRAACLELKDALEAAYERVMAQAALLGVMLRKLAEWKRRRAANAL